MLTAFTIGLVVGANLAFLACALVVAAAERTGR